MFMFNGDILFTTRVSLRITLRIIWNSPSWRHHATAVIAEEFRVFITKRCYGRGCSACAVIPFSRDAASGTERWIIGILYELPGVYPVLHLGCHGEESLLHVGGQLGTGL